MKPTSIQRKLFKITSLTLFIFLNFLYFLSLYQNIGFELTSYCLLTWGICVLPFLLSWIFLYLLFQDLE